MPSAKLGEGRPRIRRPHCAPGISGAHDGGSTPTCTSSRPSINGGTDGQTKNGHSRPVLFVESSVGHFICQSSTFPGNRGSPDQIRQTAQSRRGSGLLRHVGIFRRGDLPRCMGRFHGSSTLLFLNTRRNRCPRHPPRRGLRSSVPSSPQMWNEGDDPPADMTGHLS